MGGWVVTCSTVSNGPFVERLGREAGMSELNVLIGST